MRKVIAAINITLDGYCDHTSAIADDELHDHYSKLMGGAGIVLYGRITYQLMQYWQSVLQNPTDDRSGNEFAVMIDRVPKMVFSRTLKNTGWETATLATKNLKETISELKHSNQVRSGDLFIGSPSLIVQSAQLGLIDEYQLCVHPIIAGSGLPLFKNIKDAVILNLLKTQTLGGGHVILTYAPAAR